MWALSAVPSDVQFMESNIQDTNLILSEIRLGQATATPAVCVWPELNAVIALGRVINAVECTEGVTGVY